MAGFRGVLQTDGYEGYRALAKRGDVQLAFCWSHMRRRFVELARAGPAPIASEALERIATLYRIETEIRGRSPEERRTVRQARSRPVVDALAPWLRERLGLVSQKSKLADALRYPLARWQGLGLSRNDAVSVVVRMPTHQLALVDAWIATLPEPRPGRPEAVRKLTARALGWVGTGPLLIEDLSPDVGDPDIDHPKTAWAETISKQAPTSKYDAV